MSELQIESYVPGFSDECKTIEELCVQGEAFRLKFRRREFHLRAGSHDNSRILVARREGRIVGTVAWAVKDVLLSGSLRRAAFFFDLRTHPAHRKSGVAMNLIREAFVLSDAAGADVRYSYCVNDNRVARHVAGLIGGENVAEYRYLVWPVYRGRTVGTPAAEVPPAQAHRMYVEERGPFDFYCDPGPRLQGHVLSLAAGADAGCSVWSNAGLLEEVVEGTPAVYGAARKILAAWPLNLMSWPHIPARGEALKSWYVYDFSAKTAAAARDLIRQVNNLALGRGINFCYIVINGNPPWAGTLRKDTSTFFSPVIPYCLLLWDRRGSPGRLQRAYADIRDL